MSPGDKKQETHLLHPFSKVLPIALPLIKATILPKDNFGFKGKYGIIFIKGIGLETVFFCSLKGTVKIKTTKLIQTPNIKQKWKKR